MHWASILGLILIFLGGLLSLYGSVQSDRQSQNELSEKIDERNSKIEELSDLNKDLTDVNKELINQNSNLLHRSEGIQDGNHTLLKKNDELLMRIENYQKEIESKNRLIEDLERQAKKVARGNVSSIQFDGSYLDKSGGGIRVVSGTEENKAFNVMKKMQEENKWAELLITCNEQIKRSPTWMTSYFLKAICLLNSGNNDEAIKLLQYVERETPGEVIYILNLANIYKQIGNIMKAEELESSIPKEQLFKLNKKK